MSEYLYTNEKGISGPVDAAALRMMIASGELTDETQVCRTDGSSWRPIRAVEGILPPSEQHRALDLTGLEPYYQREFTKIYNSGESYKGAWNWGAFLLGPIWAFLVGAWQAAVTALIVTMITGGIGGVVYWIIFGLRGNYMYYSVHVKREQIFA